MKPLVFNVEKPVGMTSFDVVRYFKRNFPFRLSKIGHIGTLDPFASGVLLLAVEGASRLNDYIHNFLPKTYIAHGELGIRTETGDMTSPVVERIADEEVIRKTSSWQAEDLQLFFAKNFLGEYWQAPPAYSAAKHQGRALHEWAREGVVIQKEPKRREIYALEVLQFSFPFLTVKVRVSSGTYIRTLFEDFARVLGTLGVLHTLQRESVGHLHNEQSLREEHWPVKGKDKQGQIWDPMQYGLTLDQALPLRRLVLSQQEARPFRQGQKISWSDCQIEAEGNSDEFEALAYLPQDKYWVLSEEGPVLGMGERLHNFVRPIMNFPSEETGVKGALGL